MRVFADLLVQCPPQQRMLMVREGDRARPGDDAGAASSPKSCGIEVAPAHSRGSCRLVGTDLGQPAHSDILDGRESFGVASRLVAKASRGMWREARLKGRAHDKGHWVSLVAVRRGQAMGGHPDGFSGSACACRRGPSAQCAAEETRDLKDLCSKACLG